MYEYIKYSFEEALEKLDVFLKDTRQVGELWRDLTWIVDLCDNDRVIE